MIVFLMISEKGINPIALRTAKIVYNFGHSGCNRANGETDKQFKIIQQRSYVLKSSC